MVIREGTLVKIMATDVVPGDILYIQNGDRVAADLRLIGSTDLRVDNSSISGEGESLPRNCDTCLGKSYMEAENLLFSGTNIMAGDGYGIIIRTGDHSVFGQIARLTIGEKTPESQLSIEIKVFVRKIAAVAILTAFVFLGLCLWMGYPFPITFSFAIGIFVSYVPQGLPVTVSTLLTIAAKRMAKKNVLVKSLHAVETLGSITLLATDKTGTLTQNRMSVVGAWCWGAFFMIEDDLPENNDELKLKIELLIKAAGLCTHARFEDSDPAILIWNRKIIGDATEVGLLRFAARYSNISKVQAENQKIYEIAFTSENKWHMIVHRSSSEMTKMDCDTAYLKGAPERVLEMCAYCMNRDGERIVMNFDQKNEIEQAYLKFASQGRRVIAFAQQIVILSEEHDWSQDRNHVSMCDFTFIGLLSIMDPPKRGVSTAIKECREAGVQVVMVTGDHPVTAEAIAIDIGIITTDYHSNRMSTSTDYKVDNGDQSNGNHEFAQSIESEDSKMDRFTGNKENEGHVVVHGDSIEGLTDSDWKNILNKREVIFARTTPHQKLEIVTRFQDAGHIVGVSGDGVNDAAALKRADLGISMNRSASDVSKEAAAMILLDDNFCSIVSGIAEGRLIFANLKKSIRYTITHTMGEVLPFIAFIVLGIPLPINSMLLLVVDLGSELGPAISFAYEPAETGLMTRSASDLGSEHYMASSPNAIKEQNSSEGNVKIAEKSFGNRLTQKWPFKKKSKRGEVLVDTEMLVWAFLQGGIIMSAGAFAAYLTSLYVTGVDLRGIMNSTQYWQVNSPALRLVTGKIVDGTEQVRILGKAQSSYYAAIVIFQLFNLWITKRSRLLPFGRDMFK